MLQHSWGSGLMAADEPREAHSDDSSEETAIVPAEELRVSLPLPGTSGELDLTGLPEDERVALQLEYQRGMMDINRKAMELGVDVQALDHTLKSLAETTQQVSATDDAVTVTHTQETSIGRTEVIMGNTEQAIKGRLTKSQTGERDWLPYLIGFAIIGATILGDVIARGG